MVADGINVSIGADTRDYDRAVRQGMVQPVEDAQKALEGYVQAGTEGGRTLESTLRNQQTATGELRSELDQLNRTIGEGGQRSAGEFRRAVREADDDAMRGSDELKDSLRSNAIQTAASFTGGFDQALGGLQGLLSEFLAGFGPGGLIAGLGIATLLGAITGQLDNGTAAAQAQQQAVDQLATSYIEAGRAGERSFSDAKTAIEDMANSDSQTAIITLQKAYDDASKAGADYQQVVQAIASASPSQIATARAAVDQLSQAHLAAARSASNFADQNTQVFGTAEHAASASIDLAGALGTAEKQARQAAQAQALAARAGLSDWALQQGAIDQVAKAYQDAAGDSQDFLNKDKSLLNVKPYIEAMAKRRDALQHYEEDLASSGLSNQARKYLESQGEDTAAAYLAGYKKATPTQKAALDQIWSTAGESNATTYQQALGKSLKAYVPPTVSIAPRLGRLDTSTIDRYLRNPPQLTIPVGFVNARTGQRIG